MRNRAIGRVVEQKRSIQVRTRDRVQYWCADRWSCGTIVEGKGENVRQDHG